MDTSISIMNTLSEADLMRQLDELEMSAFEAPTKSPLTLAVQTGDADTLLQMLVDPVDDRELVAAIGQAIDDNIFNALVILVSKVYGSFCFLCDHDSHSRTPLMRAADKGRYDMVSLLIARGSDIDARDPLGRTALFYAIAGSHEATALLLLDHKRHTADEGTDASRNCVLTLAIMSDMIPVVDRLINLGADLEQVDLSGMTPLHNAARWRSPEALEFLVRAGADVNAQVLNECPIFPEVDGYSALMFAVSMIVDGCGTYPGCMIVDGCGTCPGCKGISHLTNDHRSVHFLLEHGADTSLRNTSGKTVLDIALSEDQSAVLPVLLRSSSDDALISTASSATPDALKCVLCLDRVTVHSLDSKGWSMLMHAASGNTPDVCRMLLDSGAQPRCDLDGWSPMILAAKHGRVENVRLFLPGSAKDRSMAIRFAVRHRRIECLDLLLFPDGGVLVRDCVTADPLTPNALALGSCEVVKDEVLAPENPRLASRTCVCCLQLEASVVCLPCKHLGMCPNCACSVSECPLCRVPIREKMAVYCA